METKLKGFGAAFLLSALTLLNLVLLAFSGAATYLLFHLIHSEQRRSALMWIALGGAANDLFAALFLGPLGFTTNVLFLGRKRRAALAWYVCCQTAGLATLVFAAGAYAATEGSQHEWLDAQSTAWINDPTHLALGGIVAGSVAVLHVLLMILAFQYREKLSHALHTENYVLYGDDEVAADALLSWDIDPREVSLGRKIGEGFFGEVFLAEWRRQTVVLKKLKYDVRGKGADAERANFVREVKLAVALRHPRIVQFLGASTKASSLFIVTEYMENGSLADAAEAETALPLPQKLRVLKDMALGLCYLHNCRPPIIHRDLTPNNVLLDENLRAKLADFGVARKSARRMSKLPGNILYTAPELMRKSKTYTPSCDVYSWAIVSWELLAGRKPFADIPVPELAEQVGVNGVRPDLGLARCPPNVCDIIRECWAQEPSERPDTARLLELLDEVDGVAASTDLSAAAPAPAGGGLDTPLLERPSPVKEVEIAEDFQGF